MKDDCEVLLPCGVQLRREWIDQNKGMFLCDFNSAVKDGDDTKCMFMYERPGMLGAYSKGIFEPRSGNCSVCQYSDTT